MRWNPDDPFGQMPKEPTRRGRVELVNEAARVLLGHGGEAGLFVGSALQAWLRDGGDLARDYLRVAAPRGSQHTPQRLAAMLIADEDALSRLRADDHEGDHDEC